MKTKNNKQNGFTILEMLVAVSIFTVLIILVASMFTNVFSGSRQESMALGNVDYARLVTSQFTNEIRNATYGVDGSYPLGQAGDTQIIFYSRAASSGSTINRIRYYLSGNNLYKGVIIPTGSPLAYIASSESKVIVENNISNGVNPIFTYYDGNYNGSSNALVQPVNVTLVKFIKINLVVLTQITAQSKNTFSISAGSGMRNLKTNLGN